MAASSSLTSCDPKLLRYKIIVSYDGTRFKGFQRQTSGGGGDDDDTTTNNNNRNNGNKNSSSSAKPSHYKRRRFENDGQYTKTPLTVQEFIEDALESLTGLSRTDIRLRFAGRTDGGVHARGQVCAISLPENLSTTRSGEEAETDLVEWENIWHIQKSINSRLPVDISIDQVSLCENQDFDPRKDVKLKRYSYTIKYRRKIFQKNNNETAAGSEQKQPIPISSSGPHTIRHSLDPTTIWVCPWSLDDTCLIDLCQKLTGNHDFSVFVHKHSRRDKDNNLNLEKLQYNIKTKTDEEAPVILAELVFESKGFRRSMIRNIVGFIVDVCRGAVDKSILDELWTGSDDVANKIHSAPACGLCLDRVFY